MLQGRYGADGNQTGSSNTSTSTTQSRSFDQENRLTEVVQSVGSGPGATTTTSDYVYDGNGKRLVQKVTHASGLGGSPSTNSTLYIGNLYEEDITTPGGSNPAYTVYYFLSDKMVGLRKANYGSGTDGTYRMVGDYLGSTTLVVDTSSPPSVVHREYYSPYGQVAQSFGTQKTSVGYTGQRLDSDSGLMYYGARYYDPVLAYFVSADPTVPDPTLPQSLNRFAYVFNNPIRFFDALGYGPKDYYVFVNGCGNVSGSGCSLPGDPGSSQFRAAMVQQWWGYIDELHQEYLQNNWGKPQDWGSWMTQHVRFVPVGDASNGVGSLQKELASIPQDGGKINLIGHSMGGSTILEYLARAYETATGKYNWGVTLDPRINSAVIIDPLMNTPLGFNLGPNGHNGVCLSDCNRLSHLNAWLAKQNGGVQALVVDTLDGSGGGPMAAGGAYGDLPVKNPLGKPITDPGGVLEVVFGYGLPSRHEWSMKNVDPTVRNDLWAFWK